MTSTATVLSRDPSREPRLAWRTVGAIAAATLGSGPALILCFTVLGGLVYPETIYSWVVSPPYYATLLLESSLYGSVITLPSTLVHFVVVAVLAHRARDAFGWSMLSGAVIGAVLAGILIWVLVASGEAGGFDSLQEALLFLAGASTPFLTTGALMGLLYWQIAIRPQRRWRLLRWQGEVAIEAME